MMSNIIQCHDHIQKEVVEGDMKTLKFKKDVFISSKSRRLIRGTEENSDDSGG